MSVTIERISALLMKAERTDNEHEAAAYLMKAQTLATMASIDLAAARAQRIASQTPEDPITRTVTIGEKGKRANAHLVALFVVVAHNNYAMVDVAADSTYVIAYGMPSDLDATHTLFASLSVQMATTAQQYLDTGQWRTESFRVRSRTTGLMVTKRFTKQTARAAFYRAYVHRIEERLQSAREQAIAEHDRRNAEQPGASSAALVLRNTETEVRAFHRRSSQARGRWGGYRGAASGKSGSAAGAGRSAAERARLKAADGLPGGPKALPR